MMQFFSLQLGSRVVQDKLPADFFYLHQDHYILVNPVQPEPGYKYLYTDSATSCIIAVAEGYNQAGQASMLFTHLSYPYIFNLFLNLIGRNFAGGVDIYARGANPPHNEAAAVNCAYFKELLNSFRQKQKALKPDTATRPFFIAHTHLELGKGDPGRNNRSCLGIDRQARCITDQAFLLSHEQREKTGNISTLFTLFSSTLKKAYKSMYSLWDARLPYPPALVRELVAAASVYDWQQILFLPDKAILEYFSTTPQYEPPWFIESIRRLAAWLLQNTQNYS